MIWVFTRVANSFWIVLKFPLTPPFRGEECDLIPDMELEAAEANKLERAGGAGVTTYRQ